MQVPLQRFSIAKPIAIRQLGATAAWLIYVALLVMSVAYWRVLNGGSFIDAAPRSGLFIEPLFSPTPVIGWVLPVGRQFW